MRKGFFVLAPFALVAGLHVACSSPPERATYVAPTAASNTGFDTTPPPQRDGGTQGCSESKTEIQRIPVLIELVVDESGSMSGDRWTAASKALTAVLQDMQTTGDAATFVGVALYGSGVNSAIGLDAITNPSHFTKLMNAVKKNEPGGGGTATLDGLEEGYNEVETWKPAPNSGLVLDEAKRIVVLVSDGEPNGGESEKKQCEDLAAEKFAEASPIQTFAIGIGEFPATNSFGYDPVFMGRMAVKGGTAPAGCNPAAKSIAGVCHFQVTPGQSVAATQQALVDAFNKIRALAASCEFSFEVNDQTDLSNVLVEITDKDGTKTPVDKDADNGWSFDDENNPTRIILKGDACSASSGTVSGRVDVIVGCRGAN